MQPFRWIKKGMAIARDWYAENGFYKLAQLRSDRQSWSGENVTEQGARNHSVVWACERRISESVGFLPLQLMQRHKSGEKLPAFDRAAYSALKNAPNAEMTAMSFRETLTGHVVMGGNGYAQIMRRSGTEEAYEFWPLAPEQVTPDREKAGAKRLVYVVKDGNSANKTYTVRRDKPHDILHIPGLGHDGIRGYSVIEMARQSIGTALAAERNVGRFFANGGRVPYHLEMLQKFKTDQDYEKFRADWEKVYSEPHRAPILESGTTYKADGLNMADSQMLETRLFTVSEICRWFLISPHLVGDLSHATFSNVENLALQFVNLTLMPWLKRWEDNLWRCVLTDKEKSDGFYFKHNVNALLRGDFLARMQGYATALQNGWLNQNEVRDYEDLNAFEGGDSYHVQLNMQSLPGSTPTNSERVQLAKLGTAKKGWIN